MGCKGWGGEEEEEGKGEEGEEGGEGEAHCWVWRGGEVGLAEGEFDGGWRLEGWIWRRVGRMGEWG